MRVLAHLGNIHHRICTSVDICENSYLFSKYQYFRSKDSTPSGAFFDGQTEMVEINGGTINHTLGHHTNVTININRTLQHRPTPKSLRHADLR
jgi:hypothetical protein